MKFASAFLLLPRETGKVAAKPTEGAFGVELRCAPSVTLRIRSAPPPPLRRGGV
ncbi:hypothetical protein J2X41_000109 [Caulobacter sp. BE254]|nr:hypothetical protein [Caulobacter sp. BE254]